jgi:hypothetical protein
MKNEISREDYKNLEKEASPTAEIINKDIEKQAYDSKYYSCINTLQHLLVELCKKISNLQFSECSVIVKNKMVAVVINFLRLENQEAYFFMNNFLKIINKLPEIFQKYYNLELDFVLDNINLLHSQKLFRTTYNSDSIMGSSIQTAKNSMAMTDKFSEFNKSLDFPYQIPEIYTNIKNDNIFIDLIIKYIECVRDLLELLKLNVELLSKLNEIYRNIYDIVHNSQIYYDEDIFRELIEDYEKLIETSFFFLNNYSNSDYFQNTFFPLMIQVVDDIHTLKSLLKTYKSLLSLDPISSISNMLITRKNIELLKNKYTNIFDLKIYIFFIQFFIDNTHKSNILLKTYFDNKKLSLLQSFKEMKGKNTLPSNIQIKEELFQFKTNYYLERYVKKLFEENLDIFYFFIFFERKKFLDSDNFETKENQMKNLFFKDNQMFFESSEELGILAVFHTTDSNFKGIISEVEASYKNLYANMDSQGRSNFNSFSINGQGSSLGFFKSKVGNSKDTLLIYKISSYMFLAIKIKEKSQNDIILVNELFKDFRTKFCDLHIFKTIFTINK